MVERIALLSDIHGNAFALDAVLIQLESEGIDRAICLGDVAIFGPQPRESLARVRNLACPVVMGNTDAWALDPAPHAVRDEESDRFNAVELWCATQLDGDDRAFIRTFQPVVEPACSRRGLRRRNVALLLSRLASLVRRSHQGDDAGRGTDNHVGRAQRHDYGGRPHTCTDGVPYE